MGPLETLKLDKNNGRWVMGVGWARNHIPLLFVWRENKFDILPGVPNQSITKVVQVDRETLK